jgi:hypothetical protein
MSRNDNCIDKVEALQKAFKNAKIAMFYVVL